MHLIYLQDILLKQGAGIATLEEVRKKEEINWIRLASWSSHSYFFPFSIATPCFLLLLEQLGFSKFSSWTVSSCSIPSQRVHDHWLVLNFIILSHSLLFSSLRLPKTQKSPLNLPQSLTPSFPFPE